MLKSSGAQQAPDPLLQPPAATATRNLLTLHGPYIAWTRKINQKTVTRNLTPTKRPAARPWFYRSAAYASSPQNFKHSPSKPPPTPKSGGRNNRPDVRKER